MLDMLESQVITRIKTQFSKKLKDRYPNLKFTNSDRADTVPKFPTVYIHEMTGAETGEDLQGDTINAVWSSFQIEVTTNTKMNDAKEVMNEVVRIMKTMRFMNLTQAANHPHHTTIHNRLRMLENGMKRSRNVKSMLELLERICLIKNMPKEKMHGSYLMMIILIYLFMWEKEKESLFQQVEIQRLD